ncbi:MAG: O-Antigen ligase [Mucilaginibacter sp.]|nr:O-Antigen ligase [Mucilaginibacter sp.]
MLLKKFIFYFSIIFYLYTLAFGMFMTDFLKVPAPILFGSLLLFFLEKPLRYSDFTYYKEMLVFTLAVFLYYIVGMGDYIAFFAIFVTILTCSLYFNYFVGLSKKRFNLSVFIMFILLMGSMLIMVLDHPFPSIIDPLRSRMLDEQVKQSPAGLATTQFTFGYQIAAFTVFAFVAACTFRQYLLVKIIVFCVCITSIYLGMNRSAFISFGGAVVLFLLIYYRFKAVLLIAATVILGFAVYTYVLKGNLDEKNNIMSKNQAKEANEFNRVDLAAENLKILADYPFGIIFYGKSWEEVTYRNQTFTFGLTSHNAYLMFITYLGPILGLGILIIIYYKIAQSFWQTMKNIRLKQNALYVALLFSFIAVSLNALSHNGWLMSVDGPTIFLYFAILQYQKIDAHQIEDEPIKDIAVVY